MSKSDSAYSLGILLLIGISIISPAFGEVEKIQTDSHSFFKGEKITFSGIVEKNSNGLVTIVIRDFNDEFVMLTQALINHDDSFEKTISINDKFSKHGVYTATGFILNMTDGDAVEFGVSQNEIPITLENEKANTDDKSILEDNETTEIYETEKIEPSVKDTTSTTRIANFVDISKDPQYYVDRYYNEPEFKSWFDTYYPGLTIEEAVGYSESTNDDSTIVNDIIDNPIVQEAEAVSLVESVNKPNNNSDIAEITLAIAGLGILFGAVYGIKNKVDDNSKQISINRETIKNRLIRPIVGSNPLSILQTRLVKGEISLEEYEQLRKKLG